MGYSRYRPICICRWPGCFSIEERSNSGVRLGGFCKLHYNKTVWQRYGEPASKKRHRSRRIYELLLKPKVPLWERKGRQPGTPLTPEQELIKAAELDRLINLYPPKDRMAYLRHCGRAAQWARKGGRLQFYRWRRRQETYKTIARGWLVKGNYDKELLEKLLTTGHE